MQSIKDGLLADSVGGGAPFIPLKAAQWCFKAKKLDFLGINILGIADQAS